MDNAMEILTVAELAALLSKAHIYEMTKMRTRTGDLRAHPLPVLKINSSVRFIRSDIEAWIEKLRLNGR